MAQAGFDPLLDIKLAVSTLTRIPVSVDGTVAIGRLGDAVWTFPIVGVAIGALAGGAFWIASWAGLSPWLSAMIAVLAMVLIGGGFHEDGLADLADGLGGALDKDRALEIMHDSRVGTFGVIAIVMSIGVRVAALAQIGEPEFALAALMTSAALGRAAMAPAWAWLPPAREDGLARGAGKPSSGAALLSLTIGAAVAVVAAGAAAGLLAFTIILVATAVMAFNAWRRIGGYTGDVLGAVEQSAEIMALVTLAAMLNGMP